MSNSPVKRVVVVPNKQGMHARPAEMFVRRAQQFQSKVVIVRDDFRVEAKSIMNLLMLGAAQGTKLTLEAEGDDAQEALDALAEVVEKGFLEEDAVKEAPKTNTRSEA
jgi:phosphotransferase system HPr (HPr) family protein